MALRNYSSKVPKRFVVEDAKRLVFDFIFKMLTGRGVCDAVAAFGKIGAESHLVVVLLGVHNEWSD